MRQHVRTHDFSGTVLVRKRGKTLYHESFGLADRAFNVPVTNATKFRAASITKAFTAVLILQLVEEGKLDLRAPIRAYLPDYVGEGADKVSIHNLLNHTSGIENFDRIKATKKRFETGSNRTDCLIPLMTCSRSTRAAGSSEKQERHSTTTMRTTSF